MSKTLTAKEVAALKSQAVKRGKPLSETMIRFDSLKVGEGLITNKRKSLQIRLRAYKEGKRVSAQNMGNNSYLVQRTY